MLKTKSVYDPIQPDDGLRILATRYRGRGLSKRRYHVWMACLGPSEDLLNNGPSAWHKWSKQYEAEMLGKRQNQIIHEPKNPGIRNAGQKFTLRLIKHLAKHQNVTLLCHDDSDDPKCHLIPLRKLIKSSKI
jgi:uncharacterized protein YeaO (DUF488 family)